ncbi:MAG: hypothetical protein WCD38_08325, partial [Candidatus Tumulicola sp.]
SFKVLIKELQSLALDVKVLTENREEVEIRTPEDEMGETERREYGLLMGDEQPIVSQTAVAAREAATEVADVPAAAPEEEEEEEIDDSKPLDATTAIPAPPPMPRVSEVEAEEAFEEEPAEEEVEEGAQGYELEEEDEETYEEDKPAFEEDDEETPFVENQTEDEF